MDNDRLAQEFACCGEVVSATVQTDRNTGKSRGFGYVHFKDSEAVEKALKMNGQEIDGRAINVDRSNPPDPSQTREKRTKSFGDQVSPLSSTLFVANFHSPSMKIHFGPTLMGLMSKQFVYQLTGKAVHQKALVMLN